MRPAARNEGSNKMDVRKQIVLASAHGSVAENDRKPLLEENNFFKVTKNFRKKIEEKPRFC